MENIKELLKTKWLNKDWNDFELFNTSTFISDQPLIIIAGCARSGTTLLRVMIDSHTMIHAGPHTNLFLPVKIDSKILASQSDIDISLIEKMQSRYEDRAEFISHLIDLTLLNYNKKLFCEKTARNIFSIDWIMKHFPKAKIIHVIRDGLDVVCSLRTHRKRKIVNGKIVVTGIRMPIELCVKRWVTTMETAVNYRNNNNYCEVKYEKLVTESEQTLITVCEFLEVKYEPRMLRYFEFHGPTRNPLKFIQNIEATLPIFTTSIGRWKKDLTPTELDFVLYKIKTLRNTFGYE